MKSVSSVNDMKKHSRFTKIITLLKIPVWIFTVFEILIVLIVDILTLSIETRGVNQKRRKKRSG